MEPGPKEKEAPASAEQRLEQVLSHPLRARIAAELQKRNASAPELAEALGEPLPQVSYHYGVLGAVGLTRRFRPLG